MRRSSLLLLLTSVGTSLGALWAPGALAVAPMAYDVSAGLRFPVAALDEGRHRLRVVAVGRGGGRGADVKHFHRFGGRCFSS